MAAQPMRIDQDIIDELRRRAPTQNHNVTLRNLLGLPDNPQGCHGRNNNHLYKANRLLIQALHELSEAEGK